MANVIANDYLNLKIDWRFTAVISVLSLIIALPFAAFAQASAQDGPPDGKTNTAAPKIALEEREHNFGKIKEGESEGANNMAEKSVLDFTMKNIEGKETKLSDYRGKVLLLVNVASQCGYTPQYEGLQAIYAKYRDQGLVVIGFPANNFGGQEPGTNEEIKQFCTLKYKVSFPMFAKISVKGADIHPLYKFLTNKETNPEFSGDITWNFNKFLVDHNGKVIARFETREKPEGEKVTQAIEKALK
jgi:glutathione peroxidase